MAQNKGGKVMRDLVGKDLAGWHVEVWFELRLSTNESGGYEVGGYFKDKDLATVTSKGKGWYGGDGEVVEVFVLTLGGLAGFIVKSDPPINLSKEDDFRTMVIQRAKDKLTPEERKLLGIE